MQLRPHQITALRTIYADLNKNDTPVLLSAPCGSGKTCILTKLVERYYNNSNKTFLILMHKQLLVTQTYNAFEKFTNIPKHEIGILCAGLNKKEKNRRITIGSVQTFAHVKYCQPISLLIVDEGHLVSLNGESQYHKIINKLNALNPKMRIFSCTATPYRLGTGMLFGEHHAPGESVLFPRLNHKITYEELTKEGYLVPLHGKVATTHSTLKTDLDRVTVSGDYNLGELDSVMTQARHLETAKEAIEEHCSDFKKILCFCTTINHCEQLQELLGDKSTLYHSQLSPISKHQNLEDWKTGTTQIMCSVNTMTTGVDIPEIDCLVMLRPTLSSSLYVQSIGRVLRSAPGKKFGFLLDLVFNVNRFGTDLDRIKVTVPKSVQSQIKKKTELIKLCPLCEKECHIALRQCPCGYEWPASEYEVAENIPELEDVVFEKKLPKWYDVDHQVVCDHKGKKSGKRLGRIILVYGDNIYKPEEANLWFCLADEYEGHAVEQSKKKWEWISKDPFPLSVDEFLQYEFEIVTEILLDENSDYSEIKDVKVVPF